MVGTSHLNRLRLRTALSIALLTPVGFLTKAYHGFGAHWVNNSLSGLLYVVFWCLVAHFLWPKSKAIWIAIWVFVVTSVLEIMQLWHPPFLEYLRSFYLGKVILGTTFAWSDFLYYALGAILGIFWIRMLAKPLSLNLVEEK